MIRLLTIPLLLLGFAASAQNVLVGKVKITAPAKTDTTTIIRLYCGPPKLAEQPLFVIDGRVLDSRRPLDINPDQIDSMRIVKPPAALKRYGNSAKNGTILITTKPAATGR